MLTTVRLATIVAAAVTLLTYATGLAAADSDPLVGKTYKDASATVAGWGSTAVIATVVGGRQATDDCIVTTSQKSTRQQKSVVLMNLNCGDALADAGSSGNSAGSPQGQQAMKDQKTAAWCSEPEQATNTDCATFCDAKKGLCTANF